MNIENENFLHSKKKLKWFQSRIENFNNAVPYQINALNSFKNNIRKQYRLENFVAVRQERISAEKTIRNLKQMLIDIGQLKEQVENSDHERFDKLVAHSIEHITTTLDNFNAFYKSLSLKHDAVKFPDIVSNDILPTKKPESDYNQKQILLEMQEHIWELENQKKIAENIKQIERDTQAVNEIFRDLAKIVNVQGDMVNKIEDNIEASNIQVVAAEKELAQVVRKVKGSMYPVVGALLGSFVGGPLGFVAGLKIGTLTAITGSIIGFSGGKIMKMKEEKNHQKISNSLQEKSDL